MKQNIGNLVRKNRKPLVQKIHSRLFSSEKLQTNLEVNILQRVEAVLNRNGRAFSQFRNILEFGCRFGRLTKYFFHLAPQASIFGCDIAGSEVARCQAALPSGNFLCTEVMPPLPYADGQFDCVFSYSVFTHLSEETHQRWLKELSRILKKGGVMIHTLHSSACLERIMKFSPESIEKYGFKEDVHRFLKSPPPYYYAINIPQMPEYGLAVIRPDYIESKWPKFTGLKVLEHAIGAIEGYPEGCQDIVLLGQDEWREGDGNVS